MARLDYDAIDDANKGLSICFIISITIANCVLIFKTVKKGRFLYTPKSLIMTSLAIGDIFLALFALVVSARIYFETSSGYVYSCSTQKAYRSYLFFLIHFVYGMGIIVLAGEFVQRNRTPQPIGNAINSIARAFGYGAFPWIIGLIIILPLTMANIYIDVYRFGIEDCAFIVTLSRLNAMFVVSVILPAVLAVIVCIAVMCMKLSPASYSSSPAAVTYQVPTQAIVTSSHHTNWGNAAGPPQYPGGPGLQSHYINSTQGPQVYPINGTSQSPMASGNDKPGLNNNGQIVTTPNTPYPTQQYPVQQYPVQQYPMQQYQGQQYPMQQYPAQQYPTPQYVVQYPPSQFPVQQYTAQTNVVFTAPTNIVQQQNTTVPPNPDKEKKALLIVAIIYFLCVVPFAAFILGIQNKSAISVDEADSYTAANIFLLWLTVSRSLITPIIFILTN